MTVPILPIQVVTEMANHEHRMRHYLWHATRNSWERLTPAQKQEIRNIDPGWEPPRPALDRNGNVLRDNDSGEDFLYMHRQMIAAVNDILAKVKDPNYPEVEGWKSLPPPGDSDYPVVPLAGLESVKSDDFYNNVLVPWENQYKDPSYLEGATLGQLGADVEFTIHNNMHMRWAAPSPVDYRPRTPIAQPVDPRWDDPAYDFLGDTYSSHVNPIFWKLHGWVDNRIKDWQRENGIAGDIQWKGTWVGPMGHSHHHGKVALTRMTQPTKNELDNLERLQEVIADAISKDPDFFDGFFKPGSMPQSMLVSIP